MVKGFGSAPARAKLSPIAMQESPLIDRELVWFNGRQFHEAQISFTFSPIFNIWKRLF
jgi:hypothetical protein